MAKMAMAKMVAKALRYIDEEQRMIRTPDGTTNFYVLRFKSK